MSALPAALARRLDRIEALREEALGLAGRLEPGRLTTPPRPGAWSVLEIVEHLVVGEVDVMGDLTDAAERPGRRRRLRHRLTLPLVMGVLRFRIPVKVPSEGMLPTGDRTLDELAEAWRERHGRLRALTAELGRAGRRRAIFRHPVAGPLTLPQTLRLIEVHLRRHLRQIREVEEALREDESGADAG